MTFYDPPTLRSFGGQAPPTLLYYEGCGVAEHESVRASEESERTDVALLRSCGHFMRQRHGNFPNFSLPGFIRGVKSIC